MLVCALVTATKTLSSFLYHIKLLFLPHIKSFRGLPTLHAAVLLVADLGSQLEGKSEELSTSY